MGKEKLRALRPLSLKGDNKTRIFRSSLPKKIKTSKNKFKFKVEKEAHECREGTIRSFFIFKISS